MATQPNEKTIFELLAEPFPHDVVEWKVRTVGRDGRSALALCYIDARSVMARLDEVVGPQNWRDRYREEAARMICELDIRIDGEWITKSDGSGDSDFESEKGGISGAFKRAGVKWGIGRYLYDIDALWADCECKKDRNGYIKDKRGNFVFKNWTDAGQRMLDDALRRAPGPRATGRPFSVDKMLELIGDATTLSELRTIHEQNWATIPLDYRREVLEAKNVKKLELEKAEREERENDNGRN
jgi:hypothetical protein